MVHPDKCKHARAKDAFEVIGAAHKALLDEEQRAKLGFLLDHAKGGWVLGSGVGVRHMGGRRRWRGRGRVLRRG